MDNSLITTNLRIPKQDWLQIKSIASEQDMSANEFVLAVLRSSMYSGSYKKESYKELQESLHKLISTPKTGKKYTLTDDDESIYGLDVFTKKKS